MRPMKARWIVLGVVAAAAFFGLGVIAARHVGAPPAPVASGMPVDAGVVPRVMIDPGAIQLLPDASLHLELPPGFDAGAR